MAGLLQPVGAGLRLVPRREERIRRRQCERHAPKARQGTAHEPQTHPGESAPFTFLDEGLASVGPVPSTNNLVESWNARLRDMLRRHRGLRCLCSISCCGFSHDDFSGLGRACRPRNGLNWMVLVSPPERTGKDYDQHAPSTVYPSFAAERGIRRVDRAENTCRRSRRCVSTSRRRICRPCRRSRKPRASAVGPVSARDRAVARGGSRELAQAAAYRDQDLGAVEGRAWRGGLPVHGDAGGGAAQA